MLYHKEKYWENWLDRNWEFFKDYPIVYSNHVINHIQNKDKKHYVSKTRLKNALCHIDKGYLFEVEVEHGKLTKAVIRLPYTKNTDICVVFRIKERVLLLATYWLNEKSDNHETLNKEKYVGGNNAS